MDYVSIPHSQAGNAIYRIYLPKIPIVSIPHSQAGNMTLVLVSSRKLSLFPFLIVRLGTKFIGIQSEAEIVFPFLIVRLGTGTEGKEDMKAETCFHSSQLGWERTMNQDNYWRPILVSIPHSQAGNSLLTLNFMAPLLVSIPHSQAGNVEDA